MCNRIDTMKALTGLILAVSLFLIGAPTSYGGHRQDQPSSIPVEPITFDAVYVVNGGDSTISVINAETNRLARTIVLQNVAFPHHIYQSPDGKRLSVAAPGVDFSGGHGGGEGGEEQQTPAAALVLNARTGATIKSRILEFPNHNVIYSPDGGELWTSQIQHMMPGSVLIMDADTLKTRAQITVGPHPSEVTFSPHGLAFVANTMGDSVSVIDPRTREVIETIAVGDIPVGAWQARNGFAYVDEEGSQSISAINQRSLSVEFTYDLGFTPNYALLGADNHLWVTDADNAQVVLFSPLEDVRHRAIPSGVGAHAIAFSGDGRTAYITNQHEDTVSVIDVFRRQLIKKIAVGHKPNGILWHRHCR